MSKFRLLATALLVALCTGFYSCGEDDGEDILLPEFDAICLEYGISDYKDIEMLYSNQTNSFVINSLSSVDKTYANFCGLRNNRLWIASFDIATKKKLIEWTDSKEFEKVQRVDLGYGEYKEIVVSSIYTLNTLIHNNSFVVQLDISNSSEREYLYLFKTPTSFKELKSNNSAQLYKWYNDSFFAVENKTCYSFSGDVRYVANFSGFYEVISELPISYEEGIVSSITYIKRYNYKEGNVIWNYNITPSFEVPSNAKKVITLLNNSNNIWKYRIDYTFYDGTKKDYTFSINIDNGEIQ